MKKVFLKIWQNSFFSCEFCKHFKNIFSCKRLSEVTSVFKEISLFGKPGKPMNQRSSRLGVFCKKCVLRPATLFKKRLCHRCFPLNFAKFLGTPFLLDMAWINTWTNLLYSDRFYYNQTGMLLEKYENLLELSVNRSSHQRCTVKKVFSEIRRTHRETSVPESLF